MALLLLAAFIGIPILEIIVFIEAGDRFGLWPTLAAIVVTAIIGAALVRLQGLGVLARARRTLDAGEIPMREVYDGVCLLIAGAFLLTPGFITDSLGFLLLVPPFRAWLRRWVGRYLAASGRVTVHGARPPPERDRDRNGVIIEGEYRELDETPSRWGKGGAGQQRDAKDAPEEGDRPDRPPGTDDR